MSGPGVVTAHEAMHTPFKIRHVLHGYDPDQVDDFLDDVAAALDRLHAGKVSELTINDVFDAKFRVTRLEPGYDQGQVDDFLDRVIDTLEQAAA